MIGADWQVNLPSGEVLKPVSVLEPSDARQLAQRLPVYWLSYLSPVRELTGDASEIEWQLKLTDNSRKLESNSSWLLRGSNGTEAVVLEHHH
jgi:hypothetical protein